MQFPIAPAEDAQMQRIVYYSGADHIEILMGGKSRA
jgi:hypothetical protein